MKSYQRSGDKMSDLSDKRLTRRQILKAAGTKGAALGFPAIVPTTVLGAVPPSNHIKIGTIGTGRQAI